MVPLARLDVLDTALLVGNHANGADWYGSHDAHAKACVALTHALMRLAQALRCPGAKVYPRLGICERKRIGRSMKVVFAPRSPWVSHIAYEPRADGRQYVDGWHVETYRVRAIEWLAPHLRPTLEAQTGYVSLWSEHDIQNALRGTSRELGSVLLCALDAGCADPASQHRAFKGQVRPSFAWEHGVLPWGRDPETTYAFTGDELRTFEVGSGFVGSYPNQVWQETGVVSVVDARAVEGPVCPCGDWHCAGWGDETPDPFDPYQVQPERKVA